MLRALGSSLTRRSAARSPKGPASNATRMRFGVQTSAQFGKRRATPVFDKLRSSYDLATRLDHPPFTTSLAR